MNRRSLFKSLLGVAVAVSLDLGMSIPEVPVTKKVFKYVVNPEYVSARYEDLIFTDGATRIERSDKVIGPSLPSLPPRYNFVDGKWIQVSPYKSIEVEPYIKLES